MIEAVKGHVRRQVVERSVPLAKRHYDIEVSDRRADEDAEAFGGTGIEVDLGVVQREHRGGQSELHGARGVSRHDGAYAYLPASIDAFATPDELVKILRQSGFFMVSTARLTLGSVCLYAARKA